MNREDKSPPKPPTLVAVRPLVRRNAKCAFCTSGRKFKHCCGRGVGPIPVKAVDR